MNTTAAAIATVLLVALELEGTASAQEAPRAGDRVAGGVGLLVVSAVVGVPTAGYLYAAAPLGEVSGSAVAVVSAVGLAVGIVEIITGAREWAQAPRARPGVALTGAGLTVTF